MDPMRYEGLSLTNQKSGDFSNNRMRSFHKSQRDTMRRDITAKSGKNCRYGDLLEPMSRMTMDFDGRLIDSQGRLVDPSRYFDMDDYYMDNERFIYPQDVMRSRQDTYGENAQGSLNRNSTQRGKFTDGMYRDMHHAMHGSMRPSRYIQGGSAQNSSMMAGLQNEMYSQGRYLDGPYYINYYPGMQGPPIGMHSCFREEEGHQGMYGSPVVGYDMQGHHAGGAQTLPRRHLGVQGPHRRLSEAQGIQSRADVSCYGRKFHGKTQQEGKNNVDSA